MCVRLGNLLPVVKGKFAPVFKHHTIKVWTGRGWLSTVTVDMKFGSSIMIICSHSPFVMSLSVEALYLTSYIFICQDR